MTLLRKIGFIGLVLGVALLPAKSLLADEFRFDYQKTIDIKKPVLLNLELVKGEVSVTGSEDEQFVIEALKIIRASNKDEAEELGSHIEIKIKEEDGPQSNFRYLWRRRH